jgi:hypothetical protein
MYFSKSFCGGFFNSLWGSFLILYQSQKIASKKFPLILLNWRVSAYPDAICLLHAYNPKMSAVVPVPNAAMPSKRNPDEELPGIVLGEWELLHRS